MDNRYPDTKLSVVEIQKLFRFTEKKFVHWYDLQMEMVDHLASSIEESMVADPNLTFDAALEKVYHGFGIFGFAKVVQERHHQLYRSARKKWWKELFDMFQWPKIMLIISMFSTIWLLSAIVEIGLLFAVVFILYVCINLAYFILLARDRKFRKRLLFMECVSSYYFSLPYTYEIIFIYSPFTFQSLPMIMLLAVGIIIKLTSFNLYKKMRNEARMLYPEVFESVATA